MTGGLKLLGATSRLAYFPKTTLREISIEEHAAVAGKNNALLNENNHAS